MIVEVNLKEWAASQGIVVDPAEVDDDLVRDVTEIGRRVAANRARRAVEAATEDAPA